MGLTYARIQIENIFEATSSQELELLVDTGALYSLVPASMLKRIGVKPKARMEFELADGSTVEREVGQATFRYDGRDAISPVIFGAESDSAILGVVTLEAMGLEVDPVRKQIRPTRLILY